MTTDTLEFLVFVVLNLLAYWRKDILLYTLAGVVTVFYGLYFATLDGRVDVFMVSLCLVALGFYSFYKAAMRVWRQEDD